MTQALTGPFRAGKTLLVSLVALVALAAPSSAFAFGSGSYAVDLTVSTPSGLTPAQGATLAYPSQPLQFGWNSVAGAAAYNLQVAEQQSATANCAAADAFQADRVRIDSTVAGTAYVPSMQDEASKKVWTGTYCWRVRASASGLWSTGHRFVRTWSSTPTALKFYNDHDGFVPRRSGDADAASGSSMTKNGGYLAWAPVPGAASYDLEVAPSGSFSDSASALTRDNVKGTRLSIPHLPDDNYTWRVRATSPNGAESSWAYGPRFEVRWEEPTWNDQPNVYPTRGSVQSDVRMGWTPMPGAAYYEFQAATRAGCFWESDDAAPDPYGDWVNDPPYDANNTPTDMTDDVPAPRRLDQCRLSELDVSTINNWITLENVFGSQARANMTNACWTATPATCLRAYLPNGTTGDYGDAADDTAYQIYWRVRPVYKLSQKNETGWKVGSGDESGGKIYGRWLEYEQGAGTATWGVPYNFRLDNRGLMGTSVTTRCEDPLNPSPGNNGCISHIGARMNAQQAQAGLPYASTEASSSLQMPLLQWNPFPGLSGANYTGGYIVQVSRDRNFTTIGMVKQVFVPSRQVRGFGFQQSWAPTFGLPDNSEGSGYYWRAIPCESSAPVNPNLPLNNCSGLYYPSGASYEGGPFNDAAVAQHFPKVSKLQTKVDPSFAGASPLLSWADVSAVSAADWARGLNGADYYQVQVASDPFFRSGLRELATSSPRVLPYDQKDGASAGYGKQGELPDGLWYWRVRAIDRDGVDGAWSDVTSFNKRVQAPTISSPNGRSGDDVVVSWVPVDSADSYDVEYSTDVTFSSGVTSTSTAQASALIAGPAGRYYWRVRANVAGNQGLWSAVGGGGPYVDVEAAPGIQYIVSAGQATAGKMVHIDGLVSVGGRGSNDRLVQLMRKNTACDAAGTYSAIATQASGSLGEEGTVRFGVKLDRNRCFRLAWDTGGEMVYSAPIGVNAQPAVKLNLSRKRVRRGTGFVATMKTNVPVTGRVRLQYSAKGKWYTVKTATLRNKKKFRVRVAINKAGRFRTRLYMDRMASATSGGFSTYVDTASTGPKLQVNDVWSFYRRK